MLWGYCSKGLAVDLSKVGAVGIRPRPQEMVWKEELLELLETNPTAALDGLMELPIDDCRKEVFFQKYF